MAGAAGKEGGARACWFVIGVVGMPGGNGGGYFILTADAVGVAGDAG